MSDFWAVIKDLYEFFWQALARSGKSKGVDMSSPVALPLPPPVSRKGLPPAEVALALPLGLLTEGYVLVSEARVFSRPVWAYDTVIGRLTYGTKVEIQGYQGRFVHIVSPVGVGWILKDEVTTTKTEVWPIFTNERVYLAEDKETRLIRTHLQDEFFAAELFLPLATEEYVSYRLRVERRVIPWPETRPRLAGTWHDLLRGRPGIFISLEPKTGSVMEAYQDEGEPFVAYVVAVRPDQTITLEVVGRMAEGQYEVLVVERQTWQAWRPIFIQIT